ncbi:MAG: prolipoprotein diacylglyceryl transferase [Solirubrobacterales bacterium]|nr:prolipoprotein diacylglyceryl transferase [Solirubrobacterales bacterium]
MGVITIDIAPEFQLGPLTVAWHGITIALGIVIGALMAARWLRERGLDVEPMYTFGWLATVGGIVGARVFYLFEHDPGGLLAPGRLFSSHGFTFDGGVILAAVLIAGYAHRHHLPGAYLDACAAGLPLGVVIGRVGDVINGEHYGERSTFLLAVRNAHPDALTPDPAFAYQSGGLYEVLLAAAIFAVAWPLRHRLRRTGDLAWLVLGLFAAGRFFEFFLRGDSPQLALGLNNAQWTSAVLLVVVVAGRAFTVRHSDMKSRPGQVAAAPADGE